MNTNTSNISTSIHLMTMPYNRRTIPVDSEVRVTEHPHSHGPYVEAKLTLDALEVTMYVNTSETTLALAAALERIAGALRTYEANLAPTYEANLASSAI